jgi:hypothetical protein
MIKAYRLVTGEYMICDVKEEYPENLVAQDALLFEAGLAKNEKGEVGKGARFQPLVPLGKPGNTIVLPKANIMFQINEPDEVIVDQYNSIISPVKLSKMPKFEIVK